MPENELSENELKDTQPTQVKAESVPAEPAPMEPAPVEPAPAEPAVEGKKKFPGWLAALVLIALIVVGVLGGYSSGMGKRYSAKGTQDTGLLLQAYQLGVEAANAGQYQVAKLHFEFIIQHDPEFPGVKSAYTDLLMHLLTTPSLTAVPSPTSSPTPDMRGIDEIYNNLTSLLAAPGADLCARDWNDIIGKLDTMRKLDKTYHAAEVDGMYFTALRSRGVCKIYPQTYEPDATCENLKINLAGGIYDLTLAEHFAPLDSKADALRTWARKYINGASFWDQDWEQVLNNFSELMANMPQISDSSCISATDRWRMASIGYAQFLAASGDYCGAELQFANAFTINSSKNEEYYPVATEVQKVCNGVVDAPATATP